MTAFNAATDLPPSVNSLEKLVAWANGAFYSLHKNSEYQESEGAGLVPLVTMQDGKAANKTERAIFRISLHLADNWRDDTQPFWVNIQTVTDAGIPPAYLP